MPKREYPHIGTVCGKCGETYGISATRFDVGPDDLMYPAKTEYDDPSPVQFEDTADQPELHMYCKPCDVWTVWVFDTEAYVRTGGYEWPDPDRVYWVADEYWAKIGEEDHFNVVYEYQ